MYIDAHTHLNSDQLYPQRTDHLADFVNQGGRRLIVVGTEPTRNQRAIEIVQQARNNYTAEQLRIDATVGIHPWIIGETYTNKHQIDKTMEELYTYYQQHKTYIVAIGETGTDQYRTQDSDIHQLQKYAFHAQSHIAQQLDIPVVVHSRADREGTREVVKEFPQQTYYFHCRSYEAEHIDLVLQRDAPSYIGYCGNVTYPKATPLQTSLQHLYRHPLGPQRLLIETDAPYLAPQGVRWTTNTPAHIQHTYAYIAQLLNIPLTDLQDQIHENTSKLFDER